MPMKIFQYVRILLVNSFLFNSYYYFPSKKRSFQSYFVTSWKVGLQDFSLLVECFLFEKQNHFYRL